VDQECHLLLQETLVDKDQRRLEWFRLQAELGLHRQKMEWETIFLKIKQIK
jgi:hypothetical protein